MKNKFYSIALLSLVITFSACNDTLNNDCIKGSKIIIYDYRILPYFHSIESEGSGNIFLSQEQNDTLIIETDDNIAPLIQTTVNNGKLSIESESICPSRLNFRVFMMNINNLVLGGSGNIVSVDTLHTDQLNINIDGSGTVDLFGTSNQYAISLNGSGNIELMNFITDSAHVNINGSGTIRVNAVKYLYAHINGSGNIYYKGNPLVKDLNINGSGQIINLP